MAIRILTDSASDIGQNELENVTVLPMNVTIDGVSYLDGVDLDKDRFYTLLETSETMPVTSMITPTRFAEAFDAVGEAGDEAIVLPISSGLSGTYQSAMLAATGRPYIRVVDTLSATASERLLAERAQQLIAEGLTLDEVAAALEEEKKRLTIYAVVDTLTYLKKGGRISAATALVGGMLGIKPILTLNEEGLIVSIGKARGSRQSSRFLAEKIEACGGIDFGMPYAVAYSGSDDANLKAYLEGNAALLADAPHAIEITRIGTTVGTHVGPGTVLVAFFRKNA